MSELKVCRICLQTEVKLYNFEHYQLKYYYEEVTATKVDKGDGLPKWFCFECSTILHKFHKFKEKCYVGQKILKEMLRKGPITYDLLYKQEYPIELQPNIQPIIKTNRIRNYLAKHDATHDKLLDITPKMETKVLITSDHVKSLLDSQEILTQGLTTNEKLYEKSSEMFPESSQSILNPNSVPKSIILSDSKLLDIDLEELKPIKSKNLNINLTFNEEKILNKDNWKKTELSEEEAVEEFRRRAENKGYEEAVFKCRDCFVFYMKKDTLMRHLQMRHSNSIGDHECRICRVRFKWRSHLRKHIAGHYTKYECLRCQQVFHAESSAILHDEYHSGGKKKCPYCNEEFNHMTTYYSHVRSHRSRHVCSACGASFVSRQGLTQHTHIMHLYTDAESIDDDDLDTFCAKCDITFETRKAFEEHLFQSANHTEITVEKEGEIVSKKILGKKLQKKITRDLRSISNSSPIPFVKGRRKKVKRKHRKPTTCHQCGMSFDTQRACMQHHIAEHPRTSFYSDKDRHICEVCGASLAPGSVAVHKNMHSRQQLHTCENCGKQFHSAVGLKRHMLTHTGEKPYVCPVCEKRFTQSNSMKLHHRTKHLNEPYPHRNSGSNHRTKKKCKTDKIVEEPTAEVSNTSESSGDKELPAPTLQPVLNTQLNIDDDVHYLTLD